MNTLIFSNKEQIESTRLLLRLVGSLIDDDDDLNDTMLHPSAISALLKLSNIEHDEFCSECDELNESCECQGDDWRYKREYDDEASLMDDDD